MFKKLVLVLLLIVAGCNPPTSVPENVSNETRYPRAYGADVEYCEGLGYKYELRTEGDRDFGYCIFPDGKECEAFAFVGGECGHVYTLCEIKGYTLKIGVEQHETFNKSYSICIFPDNSYCKEIDFFNRDCHVLW